MADKQIVIVGAGIAGLTAAYYLNQAGYHPVVFEESNRVGGRMTSDVIEGYAIDRGAQFLMDSYPILNSLIRMNGLSSIYVHTSQLSGTVREGKIRKTLRSNPISLLQAGTLSFSSWIRFMSRSLLLMVRTNSRPMNDYTAWADFDDQDTQTWSSSYFGDEATDYIVEPTFDGLFFQSLNEVSRAFSISIISTFFYRKVKNLTALSGGIATLPDCLASQFEVRLNTPVTHLTVSPKGVQVDAGETKIIADRVILATPATAAKIIYETENPVEQELLSTPYSSSIVIAFAVRDKFQIERDLIQIYGIMIPQKERKVISSIALDAYKNKLHPPRTHLFVAFLCGKAGAKMINWEDGDILATVLQEMEIYLPRISDNIQFTRIYRWKDAMPMSPIGRAKNVTKYRKSVGPSTRVFLAGDYMGMAFAEGAAETGKWAADMLIKTGSILAG